jgi:hypothetical protein
LSFSTICDGQRAIFTISKLRIDKHRSLINNT